MTLPRASLEDSALFAYGTLSIPSVMQAVSGNEFVSEPARLPGYQRYALHERSYPGIVARAGASSEGRVYRGVDTATLALLDRFEGEPYRRDAVRIVAATGEELTAFVYVISPDHAALLSQEPWDAQDFCARHLERYLRACREFHAAQLRLR